MLSDQDWSHMREINFTSSVPHYVYTNLSPDTVYKIRLIRIGNDNCLQRTSPTVNFSTLGNKWVWSHMSLHCYLVVLKILVTSTVNGPITAGEDVVLVCNLDTGGAPPTSVTWS